MSNPSPLTVEEAAKILKVSKYTVYELIKRGEIPAQRIGRQLRIAPHTLSYSNQGVTLSSTEIQDSLQFHFIGSHEPIVELLADFIQYSSPSSSLTLSFKGSMDGLLALFRRQAHISGIHLWDDKTGEYNIPFINYVLPGESVTLVNLVQRIQGLIVQPGNPFHLQSLKDLQNARVRFINRQKGSGTRLWLDSALRKVQISPAYIHGYEDEVQTHYGVASYVANDQADVGIGVQSAAHRMGLDFIPLFNERYDLVALNGVTSTYTWQKILSILNSSAFQIAIQRQVGYDISLTGKVMFQNR